MSSSAKSVSFDEDYMHVALLDGRIMSVPLIWYPRLFDATPQQRAACRIFARGEGLHWEELDEDISIEGLLAGKMDNTRQGRARRAELEAGAQAAE